MPTVSKKQILLVALANAGVLCIPLCFVPTRPRVLTVVLFLVGATSLCIADLTRLRLTNTDDEATTARRHRPICFAVGITILACWWLGMATSQDFATSNTVLRMLPTVGVTCMLLGAELRRRAIRMLAVDFVSDVSPTPTCKLQTSGLYGYVRHPSETGLLICVLGGAVTFGSWPSLMLGLTVLIPLSLIRVQMEEANLKDRFGEEYELYANLTGRFLPRPAFNLRTRSSRL